MGINGIMRVASISDSLHKEGIVRKRAGITCEEPETPFFSVSFDKVVLRDYERAISDNPSVSGGPPIGLGWSYHSESTTPLDEYEETKRPSRSKQCWILSREMREDILMNEWDVPRSELVGAVRAALRIKNQRRRTLTNLKCLPYELMLEHIKDGAKKVFSCASSSNLPERQNAEPLQKPRKQREPRKFREPRRNGRKNDLDNTRHKQALLHISPGPMEACSRHSSCSAETWDRQHPGKQTNNKKAIDTTRHEQLQLDIRSTVAKELDFLPALAKELDDLPTLLSFEDNSRHSATTTATWDPSLDSLSLKSHDLGLPQLVAKCR